MPILALDALRRAHDAATVLVACVVRPPHPPVRADDCPDVRHADPRALAALLDELAAGASDRICAYRATVGSEELLGDRLAGLIEWILWRESTPPSRVVAPFAFGRVGADADAPRAVDAGELRVILSRALRAAPPEVRTLPFGVQTTPAALVIARCLGALALATPDAVSAGGRWPWVREAADAEVVDAVRRARALADASPPSLLAMGREAVGLRRAAAIGAGEGERLVRARIDAIVCAVAASPGAPASRAIVRSAAAELHAAVEARGGDYEACELVARALFPSEPGDVEPGAAGLAEAPWELANARITRARIANHRGDAAATRVALARFEEAAAQERSLRVLLLRLDAGILAAVSAQNAWPFAEGDAEAEAQMARAARALSGALAQARALVALARGAGEPSDPQLGAALGTLARTLAFLGAHDEASATLDEARGHFSSALDRHLNASFRLQVELDRPAPSAARIDALLDELLPIDARSASALAARLAAGDAAARFDLDLMLRALRLGLAPRGVDPQAYVEALAPDGGALFLLSSTARSHPTELVARHAAELLRRHGDEAGARAWFALGAAIGDEGGPTLRRIARFTELLAAGGAAPADARRGSVLNPCYEYR